MSPRPASRDLFDQGSDSAPGERQTDIEDIITEREAAEHRIAHHTEGSPT